MTSERKRATNRLNAQRSTGPRSTLGKLRAAMNAKTHGLFVRQDPGELLEKAKHMTEACAASDEAPVPIDTAMRILEADLFITRVRQERMRLIDAIAACMTRKSDQGPGLPGEIPDLLKRVERLDQYERRAISRRRKAMLMD